MSSRRTFQNYRFDPESGKRARMQEISLEVKGERMLLDALESLKALGPSQAYWKSCLAVVCGSDAMNINGKNGLACLTNLNVLPRTTVPKTLPGLPVIRDLFVDMTGCYKHYHLIRPYLANATRPPERERLQSPLEWSALDGPM